MIVPRSHSSPGLISESHRRSYHPIHREWRVQGFIATRTYRCLPRIYSCGDSTAYKAGTYFVMPSDVVQTRQGHTRNTHQSPSGQDESCRHKVGASESTLELETLKSSTLAPPNNQSQFVAQYPQSCLRCSPQYFATGKCCDVLKQKLCFETSSFSDAIGLSSSAA